MPSANDYQVGGQHYASPYQHWDFAWKWRLDSFQYPISKYLTRYPEKIGATDDLEKTIHYLVKYIESLTPGDLERRHSECAGMLSWPRFETEPDADFEAFIAANEIDDNIADALSLVVWAHYSDNPIQLLNEAVSLLRLIVEREGQKVSDEEYAIARRNDGA